jgi:hypothetical protein
MTDSLVGQDIDAWCGKCKLVLAHVVVTMKADEAHKVQCKTCDHLHVFRVARPRKRRKKKAQDVADPPASEYEEMMARRDVSKATAYRLGGTYEKDDIIKHKTLGVGLVTELIGTTKIGVLFPAGPKLLVCGR